MASQSVSFGLWTNIMATITLAVVTLVHIFNIWAKLKDMQLAKEAKDKQSSAQTDIEELQVKVGGLEEKVGALEVVEADLQNRCGVMEITLSTACSADDALSRAQAALTCANTALGRANDALDRGDNALHHKEADLTRAEATLSRADGLLALILEVDKSGNESKAATDKLLEAMQTEITLLRTQFETLKPCNCKQTDSGANKANDTVEQAVPAREVARSGARAAAERHHRRRHTSQIPSTERPAWKPYFTKGN
ncbi:uncharacterized protein NECHADRAFT_82485 [Fusarium vanettenii 77-13-4]|uniref:Uncharacterized protein n=1 Tax=Fusarium vanettenii (strain ATCC MYA-4622 / CBS 123669 / FGSC 9596 / NRRL 45880 / 77-13-4) TaxID=660122 RepID=C7YXC9_FUSV7|nr:uncharacterized protein NECHADRAFT_82485 [Fusarium vanettenii 77-13-4]EEU43568.1 predicted protein [Fusarium vanettenii 77-13-4]